MNTLLIVLGVILLIPAAYVLLGLFWLLVWALLATNMIDYLIYPAIVLSTVAGGWLILHGAHVL